MPPEKLAASRNGDIGHLLHRISDDVKVLARGEIQLVSDELRRHAKMVVADAAVMLFGGFVGLIGLGILCTVAVVALAPVITALWLRLLIMAVVYLIAGGAVAAWFASRIRRDASPDFTIPKVEAQLAVQNIKDGLSSH